MQIHSANYTTEVFNFIVGAEGFNNRIKGVSFAFNFE